MMIAMFPVSAWADDCQMGVMPLPPRRGAGRYAESQSTSDSFNLQERARVGQHQTDPSQEPRRPSEAADCRGRCHVIRRPLRGLVAK
jgi:hypothetical protein